MSVYLPQCLLDGALTLLEGFEAATDWRVALGSVADDATYHRDGVQGLRLTSALGSAATITRSVDLDLSASAGNMRIYFYVHDAAKLASVTLFTSSTNSDTFAAYYSVTTSAFHNGWNAWNIRTADWAAFGGESWANTIRRLRVRINAVAEQVAEVTVDEWQAGDVGLPGVMFAFDDGYLNTYTEAFAYMRQEFLRATLYMVTDAINVEGRLSAAQLEVMNAAGWDIGNHSAGHTNLTTLSQAEAQAEFATAKAALDALGLTRASGHVAYPFGAWNATVLAAMAAEAMLSGRITQPYRGLILSVGDWHQLECQNVANTTTLETAKGYVNSAKSRNEVVMLLFHSLVVEPTVATHWAIADFRALVDYVVAQDVPCLTISDLYALEAGPITIGVQGGHAAATDAAVYKATVGDE